MKSSQGNFWSENMGEVVRFVPKSELERIRLVRAARAIYDSVFPAAVVVNEQRHRAVASRAIADAHVQRGDNAQS
jgi:hypothetical protein